MYCKNKVSQIVPKGPYDAKVIELSCGSTSIYGSPLYCDECVDAGYEAKPAWQYEDAGEEDFYGTSPWSEEW